MKTIKIVVGLVLFCFVGDGFAGGADSRPDNHRTAEELSLLIHNLPPWDSNTMQVKEWQKFIDVAQALQAYDDSVVEQALGLLASKASKRGGFEIDELSKAYLLMRVIFLLPEHWDGKNRISPGWFSGGSDKNSDGTINLSWPITWRTGKPQLVTAFQAYNGVSYNPRQEYELFVKRFPKRKLK